MTVVATSTTVVWHRIPSAPSLLHRRPLESREEREIHGGGKIRAWTGPARQGDPRHGAARQGTHPMSPWTSSSSSLVPHGGGVPSPSAGSTMHHLDLLRSGAAVAPSFHEGHP